MTAVLMAHRLQPDTVQEAWWREYFGNFSAVRQDNRAREC